MAAFKNFSFYSFRSSSLGLKERVLLTALLLPVLLISLPLIAFFLIQNWKLLKKVETQSRIVEPAQNAYVIDVEPSRPQIAHRV